MSIVRPVTHGLTDRSEGRREQQHDAEQAALYAFASNSVLANLARLRQDGPRIASTTTTPAEAP